MMLHNHRTSRFIALGFMLLMTGIGLGAGYYFAWRAPVIVRDVHEVDGVAVRGGWLDLEVMLTRNRVCDTRAERWLTQTQEDGLQRWVQLAEVASPPTVPRGDVRYVLSLPIPGNLPPGKWRYLSRIKEDCGSPISLWGPTIRDSSGVDITIVNPPLDHPAEVVAPAAPVTILPSAAPK